VSKKYIESSFNVNGEALKIYTDDPTDKFYNISDIKLQNHIRPEKRRKKSMTDVKNDLTKDERELVSLADEMASAMANLNAQTYDTFISARDNLRAKITEIVKKTVDAEERLHKMKEFIRTA
jgi:hypothetical protein